MIFFATVYFWRSKYYLSFSYKQIIDIEPTNSAETLSDECFGTSGDPFNMASQYESCSYGQFTITPFKGTINGRVIENGVYEASLSTPVFEVENFQLQDLVTSQLNEDFGPSWYRIAGIDFVMYCFPTMDFTAYAFFASYLSCHSDQWCASATGAMHEIGKRRLCSLTI